MTRHIDSKLIKSIETDLERIKGISKMAYDNIKIEAEAVIDAYRNDKEITDEYFQTFVKELKNADDKRISEFDSRWMEYRASFYLWPSHFKAIGKVLPDYYIEKYKK